MLKNFIKKGIIFLLVFISIPSLATCTATSKAQTDDTRSAKIPFGKINLYDTYFYPVGSLLASVVVPPTNYTYGGATASTVLWECDESDASDIYFLVATNGDDRVGGYYDLGTQDGIPNTYATYFAYVGIKQIMNGVVLNSTWQKVPVTTYATNGNKIQIRLQDIPPLQAELYRISSLPGTGAKSSFCWNNNSDGSGIVYGNKTGKLYTCNQPNSYIQLFGPGINHDNPGEDSATHYKFFAPDNGIAYGMYNVNTLYSTPTCVARNATSLVTFPSISVNELNNGLTSSSLFNVDVECSNNVSSGVSNSQVALGFQVSDGSYSIAKTLGLVNSNNGVSMMVSDNYNDLGMAKGVGVEISYSNSPQTPLNLIGQQGTDPLNSNYMGKNAGWYPVLDNAINTGSSQNGYTNYSYNFIANLKKISGQTVSSGKVKATATVLVKIQ